jgi:putative inorganic carbon (hco3(-)) transporter
MSDGSRLLLWLFVFSLPWEAVSLPWLGRVTPLAGAAVVVAAIVTTVVNGRFRRPGLIIGLALTFVVTSLLSLAWTISYHDTLFRTLTYGQLLAMAWSVRHFARTREEQQSLMAAYCLGAFIPTIETLYNFSVGLRVRSGALRYTAGGLNANDLALTLVLALPIAWHLFLKRGRVVRSAAFTYVVLAPVAILLTASRGAFVAGIVALSIIPLTTGRRWIGVILAPFVLVVLGITTMTVVPETSWNRILMIDQEMSEEGTLGGRAGIWSAGLQVFQERPLLGYGAGAYAPAVESLLGRAISAHNALLAVLVEQGLVGFSVFVALLAACMWVLWHQPPAERVLWAVLMSSWFVGVMSLGWQYRKITWFLFGLLAAHETSLTRSTKLAQNAWKGSVSLHNVPHTRGELTPRVEALR